MEIQPHMSLPEIERFEDLISVSIRYLEYGCGGSTLIAIRHGLYTFSVESDPFWIETLQKVIDKLEHGDRCTILKADIGKIGKWGTPVNGDWKNYWKYSIAIWDHLHHVMLPPDIILIDGRFRVACCLASLIYGFPGTRILLHDYVDRKEYHVVENFVKPEKITDTLAEFVIPDPNTIEPENLWRGLLIAVTDHR